MILIAKFKKQMNLIIRISFVFIPVSEITDETCRLILYRVLYFLSL